MIVLYAKSRTPISWAIRLNTWSPFSHVGILSGEGTVIEARFPRVREVSLKQFLADNGTVQPVEYECRNDRKGIAWARTQVGHAYDWSALFGFLFHRDWAHTGEWWCSELVAAAKAKALSPWFQNEVLDRITPQACWMMHGRNLPKLKG